MKNIKLLIVILIVAFSAFNISMSITENSENNITLNSINEHAFASSENECSECNKYDVWMYKMLKHECPRL